MKKKAQYLIEFVLVFPFIIISFFAILEYGVYYRNVHLVQDIANEAAVVATLAHIRETQTSTNLNNINPVSGCNAGALAAKNAVGNRTKQLGIKNTGWVNTGTYSGGAWGFAPYTIFEIESTAIIKIDGVNTPVVTVLVDYRDPKINGIIVQVTFIHQTLLYGVSLPVFGSRPIVIIPRFVSIHSTEVRQYPGY